MAEEFWIGSALQAVQDVLLSRDTLDRISIALSCVGDESDHLVALTQEEEAEENEARRSANLHKLLSLWSQVNMQEGQQRCCGYRAVGASTPFIHSFVYGIRVEVYRALGISAFSEATKDYLTQAFASAT